MAFADYVTEQLRLIPQNKHITKTFAEIFRPQEELRPVNEVVNELCAKHGLVMS